MFSYWKHVVAVEKMDLGNSGGEGKKYNFLIHITRTILDVRGLKD
jgi:hypothetical protein